jgi:glycosyltransferase involved in cell wall biosynthesis
MITALARTVVAFHAVKLAGVVANLVMFPVLGAQVPDPPGAGPRPDRARLPGTSLLVPARDEAHRLPAALAGLAAQDVTEIVVLDDHSSDATAAVVRQAAAADPRVRLVRGTPPPPGWTGKNWACQQLAMTARGEILLFCDADVLLAPGAVGACWAQMCAQHAEVFSVFPRQYTVTLGERLLVPLIDDVLLAFLPHRLLSLPVPSAAAANGQLIMAFTASPGRRAT